MKNLLRLAAAAAGVIACALVADGATPVDAALPLLGAIVAILGWAAPRFESVVLLGVPLLLTGAMAVPDDGARLLAYGLTLLFAAGVAVAALAQSESAEPWRAVAFIVAITALVRAIPLTVERFLALSVVLIGVTALTVVLSRVDVRLHLIPVILAVGVVTPLQPLRASVFPLLLAAVIITARSRSLRWAVVTAAVALLAGRWALLLAVLALVPVFVSLLPELRRGGRMVLPPTAAVAASVARVFAFAPSFALDLATAPVALRLSAALLCVAAVFVRPALALLYVIAAFTVVLTPYANRARAALAIPSAVFVSFWIALFAWSGVLAPFFPLPLWRLTSEEPRHQVIGIALAPGESVILQPDQPSRTVTLVASGSNISGLRAGVPVGRIDVVDAQGRGYRREVVVGELRDWGALRQEHFFAARNPVPSVAAEQIEGYGSDAFVPAFSRLNLEQAQPITGIRVTALAALPAAARVELHRLELPK